ncbi:ABC transporter [Lysinibacillus sp. CTST325]
MNYLQFEWKQLIKDKKNIFTIFIIIAYFIICPFIAQYQSSLSLEDVKKEELEQVDAMLFIFTTEYIESDTSFKQSYKNLIEQRQLIVQQNLSLKMDQLLLFVEQELQLINLQLRLIENSMAGIPSMYQYNVSDLYKDKKVMEYLKENKIPIRTTLLNNVDVLVRSIEIFISCILPFITIFYASTIFLDNIYNPSIINSIPINKRKRLFVKYSVYIGVLILTSIIGAIAGWAICGFFLEKGNYFYPKVIFNGEMFSVLSTLNYLVRLSIGAILLSLLLISLSILLNHFLKHAYANIILLVLLLLAPVIARELEDSILIKFVYFFNWLNTVQGEDAYLFGLALTYGKGVLTLIGLVVFFLLCIFLSAKEKGV